MKRKPPPLRVQLYIAFIPLLILLGGMVVYAILHIQSLNTQFTEITQQNREIVSAADEANQQLSMILLGLAQLDKGQLETGRSRIQLAIRSFNNNIERIEKRIAAKDAAIIALIPKIKDNFNAIEKNITAATLIQPEPAPAAIKLILNLKTQLNQLDQYYADIIKDKLRSSQQNARTSIFILCAGFVLSAVVTLLASFSIAGKIIEPLERIRAATKLWETDKATCVIREHSCQELEQLGYSFNHMMQNLQHFRMLTNSKILRTTNVLKAVLEKSPDPVIFLDLDLNVSYQNPKAVEQLGTIHTHSALPKELQPYLARALDEHEIVLSQGMDDAISIKLNDEDKYYLPNVFLIESFNLEGTQDRGGLALILQDITLLRLTDQLKSDLVATVSHELKTPLTSARMSLYLLKEQAIGKLNSDQIDLVETAIGELNRQLKTIQNLLDLSKVKNNQQILKLESVDFSDLIKQAVASVESLASQDAIELKTTLPEGPAWIQADPVRLNIVIENLLTNAIKHNPAGKPIEISLRLDHEHWHYTVKDCGPGIPEKYQGKVFEKFFQSSGENVRKRGSGLGLFIAKEIVDAHDGTIRCNSGANKGSEFSVAIPVATVEEAR